METGKSANRAKSGVFRHSRCVFLAHWVENWNWLLPWIKELNENPRLAIWWFWTWPFVAVISVFYLFGRAAYDEVDLFWHQSRTECRTWVLRNFGWHFAMPRWREKIYQRILRAVRDAQNKGVKVLGLGALTKAEWLTEGGARIVRDLEGELKIAIVHGDSLTAACVILRARQLIAKFALNGSPILLIGATSKIGRAVALFLARDGHNVLMFTASKERFRKIQQEAGPFGDKLYRVENLAAAQKCSLWITGKCKPGGAELIKFAPPRTIFLNFSVPDPLTDRFLRRRPDVRHFEGGLMCYNPSVTKMHFYMRLMPCQIYACHAGTIVHEAKGWRHHEVGEIDLEGLENIWQASLEMGFTLPPLLSGLRTKNEIRRGGETRAMIGSRSLVWPTLTL